jgi:sarcosine oxidase, subunit beta
MTRTADVVVVGGGVNGASIAFALASRGMKRVVLVEKSAVASGASGRSSALVRMHYTNLSDAQLAFVSYPIFRDWQGIMGGPAVFTRTGFLYTVAPEYAKNLQKNVESLKALGVNTTALSPDELKELQPFINVSDIGAAAYEPDSGYASPAEVVEGFRRRAVDLGADVLQWTAVNNIVTQRSQVRGVDTSKGHIAASVVVVAAGAWAPALCQKIGLVLPARPKAIDTAVVTRPENLRAPHITLMDNNTGAYYRPEGRTQTIVGLLCNEWDIDPDTMPTGLPSAVAEEAARTLIHRMPPMESATIARGFRAFDC